MPPIRFSLLILAVVVAAGLTVGLAMLVAGPDNGMMVTGVMSALLIAALLVRGWRR